MKNQVQLITYPDSLGGNLPALSQILERWFPGAFGGIHLLPPFPSTGDRGFAPVTYRKIDPRFGAWKDIHRLTNEYDLMLDFMVNHVSRLSVYFRDFLRRGRASKYADLFITLEKVWPGGEPVESDMRKIFLRRPHHPFLNVKIEKDGSTETVWATFGQDSSSEQIDIDVNSEVGRAFIRDTFRFLAKQGIDMLRLDAVAYAIKRGGTSCFLVEPEISQFFEWIHREAEKAGITLVLEIHTESTIQNRLARQGYWVYNFVLPLLILHTVLNRSSSSLKAHLRECPRNQITMLDCHDGIPVLPDLNGVLDSESAKRIVSLCEERGGNINRIHSREHFGAGGLDAHQINCTYYSALGCDDDAYILARAIQLFSLGIPQVYYVGLLAGENTPWEVELQGERRAINRHNFTEDEVKEAIQRPVVQRLLRLIHFRNEAEEFNGEFEVRECGDEELSLAWRLGKKKVTLEADLVTKKCIIIQIDDQGRAVEFSP